jgi:hypothetical protein
MINWIRWLRRLRYIPTRSWLKRWLLPLIHLKLSNFSSGWVETKIWKAKRWRTQWQSSRGTQAFKDW